MFRWCAYCWRFLGEKEPANDLSTTHGICEGCLAGDALDSPRPTSQIATLHARMARVARDYTEEDVDGLLSEARASGVGAMEILVAVIQPALYEIGKRWETGEIAPAQEARLTRLCLACLQFLEREQRQRIPVREERPIVLLRAAGNTHEIGARMLAFALRESHRTVQVVPKPPDVQNVITICELLDPCALGISIALPEQLHFVEKMTRALDVHRVRVQIVVGGGAIDETVVLPPGVERWHQRDTLRSAAKIFARPDVAT